MPIDCGSWGFLVDFFLLLLCIFLFFLAYSMHDRTAFRYDMRICNDWDHLALVGFSYHNHMD
jgi:hypothetical protein